jgi:deoxyhypusine synthase
MSKYRQADFSKVKTYSIKDRYSKVHLEELGKVYEPDESFGKFIDSLPDILVAKSFREIIEKIIHSIENNKPVIWMIGAHVIKCGLSPILIDLMKHKAISCIAMNGAGVIHDAELTLFGATSEDVAVNLKDGSFGMAKETGEFINKTLMESTDLGYGEAIGKKLLESNTPNVNLSILANAYKFDIPVTVHTAIGTEITHQHPNADGASIGRASYTDFKIFTEVVSKIGNGGVVLNVGSTVILPEVFLKALTIARNIGHSVTDFTTCDFDMIRHYRPKVNVVERPTMQGGAGYQITGHHEIIIPLLAGAIKYKLKIKGDQK